MKTYRKHLEMMEKGYLYLFDDCIEDEGKVSLSPFKGIGRIAEFETIDDLVNLKLINKDIDEKGMYAAHSFFFEYEQNKKEIRIPGPLYVKNSEDNNNGPTFMLILDKAKRYTDNKLRRKIYGELKKETNILLKMREIGINCGGEIKDYMALCYDIFCEKGYDTFRYHKKEALSINKKGIKNLVKLGRRYLEITKDGTIDEIENKVLSTIAEILTKQKDSRFALNKGVLYFPYRI